MKKYRNLILIFLFVFLNQCGYTLVYKDLPEPEIKIVLLKSSGNKEINNKINSKIRKHFKNDSKKEFKIELNTSLNKEIVSKDTTGKVTNYELIAITAIKINYKKKSETVIFKESLNIKDIDNTFEQKKYEDVVKNNFASSIYDKLILKLNTFE